MPFHFNMLVTMQNVRCYCITCLKYKEKLKAFMFQLLFVLKRRTTTSYDWAKMRSDVEGSFELWLVGDIIIIV